jgi:MoaA/NifB/PqqE/SkfB family radical SAM enzyme
MFFQFEVTTHCTFICFYCAGRDMPQKHMDWDVFERLLAGLPQGRHVVSLQGEGEPTLHPRFWDMAAAVRRCGSEPTTITNGYEIDVARMAAEMPTVAVSLDTLDEAEATRIGRLKLPRVLANLDKLVAVMGPQRLRIMTVDYGQELSDLRQFVQSKRIDQHIVQPLQRKDDYARRYPERAAPQGQYHYQCRFLRAPVMRFYDIAGRELPCCFIKDVSATRRLPGWPQTWIAAWCRRPVRDAAKSCGTPWRRVQPWCPD